VHFSVGKNLEIRQRWSSILDLNQNYGSTNSLMQYVLISKWFWPLFFDRLVSFVLFSYKGHCFFQYWLDMQAALFATVPRSLKLTGDGQGKTVHTVCNVLLVQYLYHYFPNIFKSSSIFILFSNYFTFFTSSSIHRATADSSASTASWTNVDMSWPFTWRPSTWSVTVQWWVSLPTGLHTLWELFVYTCIIFFSFVYCYSRAICSEEAAREGSIFLPRIFLWCCFFICIPKIGLFFNQFFSFTHFCQWPCCIADHIGDLDISVLTTDRSPLIKRLMRYKHIYHIYFERIHWRFFFIFNNFSRNLDEKLVVLGILPVTHTFVVRQLYF
jgi:hypothetical protein